MTLEPVSIVPPAQRLAPDYARRAVFYPRGIVFFLDDRSFPEPDAFWTGGARQSAVVIQSGGPPGEITLSVRNGPVENRVVMESGDWRLEMQLAPDEGRQVTVPVRDGQGVALLRVTTSSGFRPSAVDPKSRDDRFLGLWIEVQ
jgi:hypothetical protein